MSLPLSMAHPMTETKAIRARNRAMVRHGDETRLFSARDCVAEHLAVFSALPISKRECAEVRLAYATRIRDAVLAIMRGEAYE